MSRRLISVRAYDALGMTVDALVCEGSTVRDATERFFADNQVAYLQLHNAKQGYFSCQVNRA